MINNNSSIGKFNKSRCHNSHERDYNEIKALEYRGKYIKGCYRKISRNNHFFAFSTTSSWGSAVHPQAIRFKWGCQPCGLARCTPEMAQDLNQAKYTCRNLTLKWSDTECCWITQFYKNVTLLLVINTFETRSNKSQYAVTSNLSSAFKVNIKNQGLNMLW